jgi:hypothetical protein
MSLKPKRYETNQAKALRVLIVCGKAPIVLDRMSESTIAELADLCDVNGQCVPDVQERARVILFNHYESLKAVDAELE